MDDTQILQLTYEALSLSAWLVAPALLSASVVGVATGMLQSAIQLQDAALSFVPKLVAASAALYLAAGPLRERMTEFAVRVLQACG